MCFDRGNGLCFARGMDCVVSIEGMDCFILLEGMDCLSLEGRIVLFHSRETISFRCMDVLCCFNGGTYCVSIEVMDCVSL